METYAGTGLVRFEYKHLAFLGAESIRAAEASECANEQGAFWQYHDTIFANQRGENQGAFNNDVLKTFAVAIDLDEEIFNKCFDEREYQGVVEQEIDTAGELGIQSTPTLVVNGEVMTGVSSFSELQAIVEAELNGS